MNKDIKILKEYEKSFYGHNIPKTLQALALFEKKIRRGSYAESFWLKTDRDIFNYWLNDSSKEEIEEYSSHIFPFAQADVLGGIYAFWVKDDSVDLEEAPIVYGDDGCESKIVAKNLKELIKILSYGPEGMSGSYSFSEEDIESFTQDYPNFISFRQWMKETLSIEPIKNWKVLESQEINNIIEEANKLYQEDFDTWQYHFYPNPEEIDAQIEIESEKKREVILKKIKNAPSPELYVELVESTDNYNEKIGYLHEALKLNKNHTETLYKLAEYDYSNKLSYYQKLENIIENPEVSDIYYHLATAYYNKELYDKALNYYKKYLTIYPRPKVIIIYSLVETCEALNIDVKEIYEEAIKIAPTKENYQELVNLYFKEELYENAMQCLRRLFDVDVVEEHNYSIWGDNFFGEAYYDYAIEVFTEGTKKIDDHDYKRYLYLRLIEVYEEIENKEKVKEYQNLVIDSYQQALELEENEEYKVSILEDIADIYDSQGKDKIYIDYMIQALNLSNNDAEKSEILYFIAATYAKLEDYEQALVYAQKSYLLDEDKDVELFIIDMQETQIAMSETEETINELDNDLNNILEESKSEMKNWIMRTLFVLFVAIVVYLIWGATWFFWAISAYVLIEVGSITYLKVMIRGK